jgi:hypothetical protein
VKTFLRNRSGLGLQVFFNISVVDSLSGKLRKRLGFRSTDLVRRNLAATWKSAMFIWGGTSRPFFKDPEARSRNLSQSFPVIAESMKPESASPQGHSVYGRERAYETQRTPQENRGLNYTSVVPCALCAYIVLDS